MNYLLKNILITCTELHFSCLIIVVMLYINMRISFRRNIRDVNIALTLVYLGIAMMLISDCGWTVMSSFGAVDNDLAYFINILYFLGSSAAAACWFMFCVSQLDSIFSKNIELCALAMAPFAVVLFMYLLSPWYGLIFYIDKGVYVRGSLFFLDPIIKIGYIVGASVLAVVCGRKKEIVYLKKKDFALALFGVPVIVCGILQSVTGVDFNCLGATFGLILVYITGITNLDSENTEAIFSLANSYEASYIVNMDTGIMRPLRMDSMHDSNMFGMDSLDYTTHFNSVLSAILVPEDRSRTLETFDIKNVSKRFEIDSTFSIRYRVKERSGKTALHNASFICASEHEGRQEFLLGINTINSDSLMYERNVSLLSENQRLEQVNMSIIDSVAKIVESRDCGSGEHIVRVKKLTEILAREIMADYPEYNLDDEMVKFISSASVLHDVGKISIPDAILLKPGRLTAEEFEIMKTHSAKGCDILNLFPLGLDDAFMECAMSICRWHHEKYDGKGYPDGLKGEEIPIAAQIVSVADCFDALTSERPYKEAFTPEKALEMIFNGECGEFSPKIICLLKKKKSKLIQLARLYR